MHQIDVFERDCFTALRDQVCEEREHSIARQKTYNVSLDDATLADRNRITDDIGIKTVIDLRTKYTSHSPHQETQG